VHSFTGFSRLSLTTVAALSATGLGLTLLLPAAPAAAVPPQDPDAVLDRIYPAEQPAPVPGSVTDQVIEGLPDGVSVDRVEWQSDRLVNLYIRSAAMPGAPVKVQVMLARDWYRDPDATFPTIYAMDGLRTGIEQNGWLTLTDVRSFYADKNVNVVLPVGGPSSFYTDWENQPADGVTYNWETFLTDEVTAVMEKGWRSNDRRAIIGLSMGATGAANIAQRHPDMYRFLGSFSGYLATTSPGMPEAINFAVGEGAPGYTATDMWGPYYSQDWRDHDPALHVDRLRNMKVYVSAGNGNAGAWDTPGPVPGYPEDPAAWGLESLARMSSQTFVNRALLAGVDVTTAFRPNGTHRWEYWNYEMQQAWPDAAKALGVDDSPVECTASGKFADAVDRYRDDINYDLGDCISDEEDAPDGGRVQEFRRGTLYLAKGADQAVGVWGRTAGLYAQLGGPDSWLGYPLHEDAAGARGGSWARFENGYIYWTPEHGFATVRNDIAEAWGRTGWEWEFMGYPLGDEEDVTVGTGADARTGQLQTFEGGTFVRTPDKDVHYVRGYINERYRELGGPAGSKLGFPTGDQGDTMTLDGAYSDFEDGVIYWSEKTGTHYLYRDAIYDRYAEEGFEGGRLGFLTRDVVDNADGSRVATFEHGTITRGADGKVKVQLS
jgi:S-formylglutathione hydrolase FrmB